MASRRKTIITNKVPISYDLFSSHANNLEMLPEEQKSAQTQFRKKAEEEKKAKVSNYRKMTEEYDQKLLDRNSDDFVEIASSTKEGKLKAHNRIGTNIDFLGRLDSELIENTEGNDSFL